MPSSSGSSPPLLASGPPLPPRPLSASPPSSPPPPDILFPPGPPPPPRPNTDPRANLPADPGSSPPTVSSKLQPDAWARYLADYPDDGTFSRTLVHIIRYGARLGFAGDRRPQSCSNLSSAFDFEAAISADVDKQTSLERCHGPFATPPFANFRASPLGSVEKRGSSKRRRIHHLSWPRGASVNAGIPKEEVRIEYEPFVRAVATLRRLGRGTLFGKLDLEDAFRQIPVSPDDWELLGFTWARALWHEVTLTFGVASAPYIFNLFAEALHWIIARHVPADLQHYLDDFLLAFPPGTPPPLASAALAWVQALGLELGLAFQPAKTEGPCTSITFLGLELDSIAMEARLPADKLSFLRALLSDWVDRPSASLRDTQSLIGYLMFCSQVIPHSRTFLRRLLDFSSSFRSSAPTVRRRLPPAARADLRWWLDYALSWNGVSVLALDPSPLLVCTDASGTLGIGGWWLDRWFSESLPARHVSKDIQFKEAYAVLHALRCWGAEWRGRHVRFGVDNQAVVFALRSGWIDSANTMAVLRRIAMLAASLALTFEVVWVPTKENAMADALSRLDLPRFRSLAPLARQSPSRPPPSSPPFPPLPPSGSSSTPTSPASPPGISIRA